MRRKIPKEGDVIEHTCALHGDFFGRVILVLNAQFLYETEQGSIRHCMFSEVWRFSQSTFSRREDIELSKHKDRKAPKRKRRASKPKKKTYGTNEPELPQNPDLAKLVNKVSEESRAAIKPKKGETVLDFIRRKKAAELA